MERIKPIDGEIYHIYNRGVEKRKIFMDELDYLRFIHDLFEFNDEQPANLNFTYYFNKQSKEVGLPKIKRKPRRFLVDILSFCLMPNHFHLMVRQKGDNGISEFIRKIGGGYTNYFNQKYERVGPLFQGKYKYVHIVNNSHFTHLPNYIHLNPVKLIMPNWKERVIRDYKEVIKFLENYRWSSFPDYIGKKNFPSVTQREFLLEILGNSADYKKDIKNYLKEIDWEDVKGITLD